MKRVSYLPAAQRALLRHRAEAPRIMAKIAAYARDPQSQKNNVKRLKGKKLLRLRVGAFRVVIAEDRETVKVIDLGPRDSIYD